VNKPIITQHHFKLLLTKDGTRVEKTWISCGNDKAFGAAFDPTKKTPGEEALVPPAP